MEELSKSEEKLMKLLWKKPLSYMKDLLAGYEEPIPAPTSLATLLMRMRNKGFVDYEKHGSVRAYFPLVSKANYFKKQLGELIENHFENSASQFASFFTKEIKLTDQQLQELKDIIDQQLNSEET